MDVRGNVIIQSIMSEPWIGPGARGGHTRDTAGVGLIASCDAHTLLLRICQNGEIKRDETTATSAREEEEADLGVKCAYQILFIRSAAIVKELLHPN